MRLKIVYTIQCMTKFENCDVIMYNLVVQTFLNGKTKHDHHNVHYSFLNVFS